MDDVSLHHKTELCDESGHCWWSKWTMSACITKLSYVMKVDIAGGPSGRCQLASQN